MSLAVFRNSTDFSNVEICLKFWVWEGEITVLTVVGKQFTAFISLWCGLDDLSSPSWYRSIGGIFLSAAECAMHLIVILW